MEISCEQGEHMLRQERLSTDPCWDEGVLIGSYELDDLLVDDVIEDSPAQDGDDGVPALEATLRCIRDIRQPISCRLRAAQDFQQQTEQLLGLKAPRNRRPLDLLHALADLPEVVTAAALVDAIRSIDLREKVWPVLLAAGNWSRVVESAAERASIEILYQHGVHHWRGSAWDAVREGILARD